MLKRIELYFNTLKYLKSSQVFGRIFSEFKKELYSRNILKLTPLKVKTGSIIPKTEFIFHEPWNDQESIKSNKLTFIGISHKFNNKIDWNIQSLPLLWKFNLHYFNFMHLLSKNDQIDLCNNWNINNTFNNNVAWHPYVLSLRIINWCKANLDDTDINSSLYLQSQYLYRNLEFYHPANHYLENARALIFAGLYFEGQGESDKWLNKGFEIFSSEAKTQILDDGGYFEKSIMYHAIILEGILDIINILPVNNTHFELFTDIASKMLKFLIYSTHPNGSIALFNDSTEEIAPTTKRLVKYAERLNLIFDNKKTVKYFKNSEIFSYSDKGLYFIIKGGKIGPDNIPAHAHADIFTYELSYLGEKIIVDSGVFDYQNNEMRNYCRSTSSHNCVSIDNTNQAEMWSVFRVGKRYYPKMHEIKTDDNSFKLKESFEGYSKLIGDNLFHERTFHYKANQKIFSIEDEIFGVGEHTITSNIHFHPSFELIKIDNKKIKVKNKDIEFNIIVNTDKFIIDKGYYCPRFGEKSNNCHLKLISNELPSKLIYELHF